MKMRPKLDFECGDSSLEVRRVTVRERMSECFVVDVIARSPHEDLDLEAFVGKAAGFGAESELGVIGWTGVCNYMELVKPAEETHGMSTYSLRIVPALWLLTQRRGHRIFQHRSTPDIVKQVLSEHRIEPRLELTGEYPPHEYRVQYGNSDFQLVSRLLEDAGISYFFRREHAVDKVKSVLVLSDAPHRASTSVEVRYYDAPNEGQLAGAYVSDVEVWHGVRPGKLVVRDYDYRRPQLELSEASKLELPAEQQHEDQYEQYAFVHGGSLIELEGADDVLEVADDRSIARHHQPELAARALRHAEAARYGKHTVGFRSNHPALFPSTIFTIDGHPRGQVADAELMVLEVNVLFSELEYEVVGLASFRDVPHRPERVTPKPVVEGVQTAMVVGPPGEEIHTDEFGRVRVRFHWDREGASDDSATCWLRVSQAWAGAGFGVMHVPRVGQEVIVDFFDGDPDQPLVVGRLYNATAQVPRRLPEHQTQSIWRSATSPHTDGRFNEIGFEDKAGKELYFMQAQRDLLRLVKRNDTERTGENRTIVVGEGRVAAIAEADTLQVGKQHLIQMAKVGDLHIADLGDPEVKPLPTFVEMKDGKIVLTTGQATIALEGPNITVEAAGGLRFTTDGKLILQGSMIFLNVMPGQVNVQADQQLKDRVAKPDRMIGAVARLFWQPFEDLPYERYEIEVTLEAIKWARAKADEAPKPDAATEAREKARYVERKSEVQSNYDELMNDRLDDAMKPPVSKERLELAVKGDPVTGERVPLTFESIAQYRRFQRELKAELEAAGIDDAIIQQVGSGTTGWRGNPLKPIKPWSPTSDTDFAIFSPKMLRQAQMLDTPVNTKIIQGGTYTVFKNGAKDGTGFYSTPAGRRLKKFARKWNREIYGRPDVDGIDFKLNTTTEPFTGAITVVG